MTFGDVAGRCSTRMGRSEAGYSFIVERSRDSERSAQGLSQGAREWAGGHGAEGEGRSAARSPRRISRQCRFGGGKGLNRGFDARGPSFLAGQSAEPVPDRLLRPDAHSELDDFPDCHVGPSAPLPSCRSFRLRRRLDQLARTARGICAASLLISHSLPSLPHPLHLKTFSHQDSTNEGPFAFAHSVQIQGYSGAVTGHR